MRRNTFLAVFNNKQKYIYLLLIYLCCLFFIRDIQEHDIGKMIFIIPVIFSCLLASKENLYYLIALLLPLGWGLSVSYVYPILVLLLIFRNIGPIKTSIAFSLFVVFYELFHYLFYPLPAGRFEPSFISSITCLSFFASYFVFNDSKTFDKDKFVKFFCIGTSVFFVFILLHSAQIFGLLGILSGLYRLGDVGIADELEGSDIIYFRANANYISYYSSVAIACVVILMRRKTVSIITGVVLLAIFLCAGFSTQSRTWILITALFFLCFAFSFKRHRIIAFGVVATLCVIVLMIALQFEDLIEAYKTRFSFDDATSTMSEYGGRPELIKMFNDYLSSHIDALIWGVGVNGQPLICKVDNGATSGFRAPHNAIQEIVVCYGLIGLYVYIIPFFKRLKILYRQYKPEFVYVLPLLMVIMILQTIQILYPPLLIAPLIPAILIFTMNNK